MMTADDVRRLVAAAMRVAEQKISDAKAERDEYLDESELHGDRDHGALAAEAASDSD